MHPLANFINSMYISGSAGERAFVGFLTGLTTFILISIWVWLSNKRRKRQENKEHEQEKSLSFAESDENTYYQSLVSELLDLCSPEKYIEPYDFKKVKVANELYGQLHDIHLTTTDIIAIRKRAENELGVMLSTKALFTLLEKACNPRRFLSPYQPELLDRANELYSGIIAHKNSLSDLEKIGVMAREEGFLRDKPLDMDALSTESTKQDESQRDDTYDNHQEKYISDDVTPLIIILIIAIIIFGLGYLFSR